VEVLVLLFIFFLHTKKKFFRSHIKRKEGVRGGVLTKRYQVILTLDIRGLSPGKLWSLQLKKTFQQTYLYLQYKEIFLSCHQELSHLLCA